MKEVPPWVDEVFASFHDSRRTVILLMAKPTARENAPSTQRRLSGLIPHPFHRENFSTANIWSDNLSQPRSHMAAAASRRWK